MKGSVIRPETSLFNQPLRDGHVLGESGHNSRQLLLLVLYWSFILELATMEAKATRRKKEKELQLDGELRASKVFNEYPNSSFDGPQVHSLNPQPFPLQDFSKKPRIELKCCSPLWLRILCNFPLNTLQFHSNSTQLNGQNAKVEAHT